VADGGANVTSPAPTNPGHEAGRLVRSAVKALNYLRVHPVRDSDLRRLWGALGRAALHEVTHPADFGTVGTYLTGSEPLQVHFDGLTAQVRPGSDDLAILLGNHEPEVLRWFAPRAGEVVVDVGAHIGLYTLRAARRGARVIAFEPNPGTAAVLDENLRLNGFHDVTVRHIALGTIEDEALLHIPSGYAGRSSIPHARPSDTVRSVPVARLDDVLLELGVTDVDWLKIDVEGAEADVLAGAARTLERTRTVILEVEHGREQACRQSLRGHGLVEVDHVAQPTQDYWLLRRPVPGT
jgi:FkbM family methyltransferase